MRRLIIVLAALFSVSAVRASWYWPFGGGGQSESPRLSTIMEGASTLIDEASDLAAEGKLRESVEKYRAVLTELNRIELENADRVSSPEFATVRNKRAYVNAAIDSLLLTMAQTNAKSVAVSDTTELEKRFAAEKAKNEKTAAKETENKEKKISISEKNPDKDKAAERGDDEEVTKEKSEVPVVQPSAPRDRVVADLAARDFEAAKLGIAEMLVRNPNDIVALNLQAALEAARGDYRAAERTLDKVIESNPRDYHAYYNMATVMLSVNPTGNATAKRYYEAGRSVGGPVDAELEKLLK